MVPVDNLPPEMAHVQPRQPIERLPAGMPRAGFLALFQECGNRYVKGFHIVAFRG
jgi:hypothetical protein